MLKLPPLNALKYFEAAARTGSYVTAAAELNVSPAAVSQQVRNLERFLKRKLFTRLNNRIVLTDAGQAIHAGITPALEDLAALTQRVLAGSSRAKLAVSVIPSLAECWFMPAFAAFSEGAALRIDLRIENDPVNFADGEIDLRIGYASAHYPGLQSVPLFRDAVLPLCQPALAARLSLAAADDSLFIHTSWGEDFASHPSWEEWFASFLPARRIDTSKGHRAGSSQIALDFARRGLGIALGQRALAQELLRKGDLVMLDQNALPLGHDYCAIYPSTKARKAALLQLTGYLRSQAPHR
ncbi:LysR substrate-binding domain-containing protein [Aestuariivirga sp.]|uniref:LysR substrate-binding domain-containing protein n=1 Tax=Aestuariivirga sp. TaxID=2650926 RepID=UPI003BA956FF